MVKILGVTNKSLLVPLKLCCGFIPLRLVNVARFAGTDPEDALNEATRKFIERFARVEDAARSEGKSVDSMTLEELDALWENVKK